MTTGDAERTPPAAAAQAGAPLSLEQIERRVQEAFPGGSGAGGGSRVAAEVAFGELTLFVQAEDLVEVLTMCRDDEELACDLLADLSSVHWPAGDQVVVRQPSTTGWPDYRVSRERGVVEVAYVLRSLTRNHWFRVSVGTDDESPRLPSVVGVYPTANFHEREVYDFFGVEFEGHPSLTRILMPDDWLGHPLRKDYPLGGVDVPYKNDKFIPPPDERDLREIVE